MEWEEQQRVTKKAKPETGKRMSADGLIEAKEEETKQCPFCVPLLGLFLGTIYMMKTKQRDKLTARKCIWAAIWGIVAFRKLLTRNGVGE